MLARIGAANVPTESWQVTDGMFPSIVVAHVDRLVPTPKPPAGSFGAYGTGQPGVRRMLVIENRTRELVLHQVGYRAAGFAAYHIRCGMIDVAELDARGLLLTPPAVRQYPMYSGGAPPTTACWETYSASDPTGWGPPVLLNWMSLCYAANETGALRGLDWLVPLPYAFMMWTEPVAFGFHGVMEWHEQPPGAHTGDMIAFP